MRENCKIEEKRKWEKRDNIKGKRGELVERKKIKKKGKWEGK